ncbi:MAG: sensor histidine kinase [Catenulispora sp.]|nr:sensor histidine kinase [Catenulispora sp.]
MHQERGEGRGRGVAPAGGAHVPGLPLVVLVVAAAGEALVRSVVQLGNGDATAGAVASALFLALCATVPLGFLGVLGAALAVGVAAVLALVTVGSLTVGGAVAVVVAAYRLGWAADGLRFRRTAHVVPLAMALPFLVVALADARGSDAGVMGVCLAALVPAAALAGNAGQARTQARVHNAAREAVARSLVEHTARGERARIARELHDVVAHHISMIAVQAETARLATPGMPALGAERLLAIGDTARAGLTEMRRLLGVLKEDVGAGDQGAERHPQPGLYQLLALVDDARRTSGTATRLIVSGVPAPLDPGVELAAYRIAQEALTNARRHARGAPVDVELRFEPDALRLRIMDSGTGVAAPDVAPSAPGGHGLSGMRERAASVGGRLEAGPGVGGGYVVEAWLPADVVAGVGALGAVTAPVERSKV